MHQLEAPDIVTLQAADRRVPDRCLFPESAPPHRRPIGLSLPHVQLRSRAIQFVQKYQKVKLALSGPWSSGQRACLLL